MFLPLQSECMQETFHHIHAHQNSECNVDENEIPNEHLSRKPRFPN